ncbi:WD40-repeat-containing domain protein [Paraphysoderma sedebokerense]|nr:WD40-repeat-containing domain protein [Paraphysoderma sedebokerense]
MTQPNAKPCINIYALPDFRKRKTLAIEDLQGSAADLKEDVISMNFSADSKYLALLSASNTLSLWLWDKTRCFAAAKIPLHSDVKYSRSESKQLDRLTISVNPFDDSQTVVVAEGLFRHLTISEANVKISKAIEGLQRSLVTCHAWISADRSAVATSTGSIHIIEHTSATIKNTISISVPASTDNGANPKPTSPSIDSLHVTAQSLVVVCPGSVHLFDRVKSDDEQHESTENYKATKTINLNFEQTRIKGTALAGNVLIITDQDNQTVSVNVSSAVDTKKPEDSVPKLVFPKAHHGAITGLAACVRKPLIATCSIDKSIRVWNYITRTLEMTKYFAEEPLSVSIHPSGLYLIAGFTDKLRMMSILTDDLRVYRELSVRGCRECAFSSGGQFLAAAQGSVISLYSTWSFEVLATLKGHNGKIRSLYWSLDDTKLVSAGSDGAVYTWTVKDLKRENECIIKSCSYSSAVCGSVNDRTVFAVGTDKMLKEITDSVVVRELQSSVGLTQVLISNSGKMMFVSTILGTVKAVRFPLPTDLTDLDADELAQEHQAHGVPVTKLRISFDDRYLFSACEDGFIYIYRITDRDTKNTRGQPLEVTFAEEVLVTKTDLEEKNSSIIELKNRMEELKIEHDYQIRLKDMHLQEKMKELTTELAKVIESLRLQTAVLRAEKDKEDTKHREDYELLMNKNRQEYRDAENKNNNKLMAEFEKYNVLQEESRQKQRYWDENFKLSEQNRTVECHQLSQIYDDKLRIKAQELSKVLYMSLNTLCMLLMPISIDSFKKI